MVPISASMVASNYRSKSGKRKCRSVQLYGEMLSFLLQSQGAEARRKGDQKWTDFVDLSSYSPSMPAIDCNILSFL